MTKLIVAFRNFANAPKNLYRSITYLHCMCFEVYRKLSVVMLYVSVINTLQNSCKGKL
jgi:hypothetical protein